MTRIITHFMTHSKPVFGQECYNILIMVEIFNIYFNHTQRRDK